jgi:methanogenic corrinoid protein MtbC1
LKSLTAPQLAFLESLLSLDGTEARRLVHAAAAEHGPVHAIEELVAPALEALGTRWEQGTAALSQIYMGGRLCEEIVGALLPSRETAGPAEGPAPRAAIAVISDRHMLGKRIVASVVRAAGFDLADYGHGTAETLAARARADRLDVLLVSALMLPSALEVKRLTAALEGTAPRVRVVVGGAPFVFDDALWREVGADACGRNAGDAVEIMRTLTKELAACPT